MDSKIFKEIIKYFYPLEIIILLFIFRYITLTYILLGYLLYCFIIYFTTHTYLYYIKTQFNIEIIENCPSIKNANFKQYFLFPFTFCQFILFQMTNKKYNKVLNKQILFEEEEIDSQGTLIVWASYEYQTHINPILLILPGITGHYHEDYIKNIIREGLNNNFDVVIFQMSTLSEKMRLEKNKHIDFYEDLNNSLKKIKEKNSNILYAIGYSYGANLLTGYMGSKNLETNYIDGGVAVSNPFDLYMSQRIGANTIYESLICHFERKNYMKAVNSINENSEENLIDVNVLQSSYNVKIFDKEFFGKILGYNNGDDYYKGISSAKYVKYVNKPLLVIHSKDDPICSYKGIPFDDVCENKNIIFIFTEKGGHFCYIENDSLFNFKGKLWSVKPTFEFINYLKNIQI